jgi:hypothetical protein
LINASEGLAIALLSWERVMEENAWHLDKRVSIANIVVVISLAVTLFLAYSELVKNDALTAQRLDHLESTQLTLKNDITAVLADLKYEMREIRTKLDKARQ